MANHVAASRENTQVGDHLWLPTADARHPEQEFFFRVVEIDDHYAYLEEIEVGTHSDYGWDSFEKQGFIKRTADQMLDLRNLRRLESEKRKNILSNTI